MLQAIERYMKQAIVDKVPSVSSSALVSSLVSKAVDYCKSVHCVMAGKASLLHCVALPGLCFVLSSSPFPLR